MGQHRPPDRPTYPPRRANIAPRWANIAPRWTNLASRWGNIAFRSCSQLDPSHLNMGPWPAVARKRLNSAPPAPHEYADKCVTSVPERLELYGEARPKPPTLQRRAPKNAKNPSGGWGRAFWPESGSLISVSKSKRPPPFGGYLKSEKSAVLTHFSDDFSLFESHKML